MNPNFFNSFDSLILSPKFSIFSARFLLSIYNPHFLHRHSFSSSISPRNSSNSSSFSSSQSFDSIRRRNPKISRKSLNPKSMATCVDTSRAETNQTQNRDRKNYSNHFRSNFSDRISCAPICQNNQKPIHSRSIVEEIADEDDIWFKMIEEAKFDVGQEPILSTYYYNSILSHKSLESALANHLASKLSSSTLPANTLFDLFLSVLIDDGEIINSVKEDLRAVRERDPACVSYIHCLLSFKGFLACQSHRIAHKLWTQGRKILALLIQNRVSEAFAVDIHPGAKIGQGILFDHASGVVIGETAVIGDNVSILHNVTLGGTGKMCGDRHPKIGDGVLIGAGTCVLGNVKIGDGAKIGAGSVVLKEVPARTTAVGNPARLVGGKENPIRHDKMPSFTMDHTSYIQEWSDYVI